MKMSIIYRSPLLYESVMRVLYGRHYVARREVIANLVRLGDSVLDLCCGPGTLYYRHLRSMGVAYHGIDLNEQFIERLRKSGAEGSIVDLRDPELKLPTADVVIMQDALMHFLPDPAPIVDRMLAAARRKVVIAEPVRNLASSSNRWVAFIAARLSDPGTGDLTQRFNETSLDAFFEKYANAVDESFLIPGGRDKVYALNATAQCAANSRNSMRA